MGYIAKTWNNPITLDSNNLNRIEQGIKSSHDTLEIISEEVSTLQTNQLELQKELNKVLQDSPEILDTLDRINALLENSDIENTLNSANNLLLKTEQSFSIEELNQIYKNLKLNSFLKLTDIKVNNSSVVNGSVVNINLPKVDTELNINSNNAISNSAIAKVLKDFNPDVEVPTKLSDLDQDPNHQTVTIQEKSKWNAMADKDITFTETDPTVPAWAKEPLKPFYTYNEILNTPSIPTNNKQLINGAGYITSEDAISIIENELANFGSSEFTSINNKLVILESTDTTIMSALNNKAPIDHSHDYAPIDHTHDYGNLYALLDHTHDYSNLYAELNHKHEEYKTYTDTAISNLIGTAPDTLNTLQELAEAFTSNKDMIELLEEALINKSEKDHNHDDIYLNTSGDTLSGPLVVTGGDAASGVGNIQLDTNGQITAKDTTATLFGRNSVGSLLLGHSSHALSIRGSATRPTYNGKDLALSEDTVTSVRASGSTALRLYYTKNGTETALDLLSPSIPDPTSYYGVYTTTIIDASGLNQDTWYPVVIHVGNSRRVHIDVRSRYELTSTGAVNWSTHNSKGFVVHKNWSVVGSGWGTNNIDRVIHESHYGWCNSDPVRGIGQLTNSSDEYVFVRGGGQYVFNVTDGRVPTLYSSSYTNGSGQSVSATTSAPGSFDRTVWVDHGYSYKGDKQGCVDLPNGTRIIWGYVSSVNQDDNTDVTFHNGYAFSTNPVVILASYAGSRNTWTYFNGCAVDHTWTNGFRLYSRDYSFGRWYIAIGQG